METAPGVALLAVVAFAVGIGSATAIFTVVNGVLLRPPPYPDGERFVAVRRQHDRPQHDRPAGGALKRGYTILPTRVIRMARSETSMSLWARGRRRCAALVWSFVLLAAILSGVAEPTEAQTTVPADRLAPVASLVGQWKGTTEGQPGKGEVERRYERVLGSKFIQVQNRSSYPPQEKNPKGETHEDIGFFSFDSARKRVVFRQFHVEGFVNQYVLDPLSTAERVVFTSESIENIPAGFRARETYVFLGGDQIEEVFEIAEPGKDFEVYSRSRLTRVKQPASPAVKD